MALSMWEQVIRKLREFRITDDRGSVHFSLSSNSKTGLLTIVDHVFIDKVSMIGGTFRLTDSMIADILTSTGFDADLYHALAYNGIGVEASFIASLSYD